MAEHVSRPFLFHIKRAGRYVRASQRANLQYIFRADKTAPFINRKPRSFANADDENEKKASAGRTPLLGNYLEKLLLDFPRNYSRAEELVRLGCTFLLL